MSVHRARRPRRRLTSAAALLIMTPLLAACEAGSNYPQTTFRPVSEFGILLNQVFYNTFAWTMGILVIVIALILYAALRFRERPDTPHPEQVHGNTTLEIAWTIVPAVIVVFMGVPTVRTIFDTQRAPPEDALVVEVIGHQWWWEFRYPEYNIITANQLWVPTGRPVSLQMHASDVIHSFWIPKIGGKRDVNPLPHRRDGEQPKHKNYLLFTVDEPGHYLGQCAEYCGESHAIMRMTVMATEPAEFDQWVGRMRGQSLQVAAAAPAPAVVAPAAADGAALDTTTAAGQPAAAAEQAAPSVQAAAPAVTAQPAAPARTTIGQIPVPTGAGNPFRAPLSDEVLYAEGERLFLGARCVLCHAVANTTAVGALGPNLTLFGSRPDLGAGAAQNTRENLIRWIRDPQSMKPGTKMPGSLRGGGGMAATGLSDQEVRAIAAYLSSLK
jgi:cytochrome c oxidase subunit II